MDKFASLDIDEMFAAAASAAEDTGEDDVGGKEEAKKAKVEKPMAKPAEKTVEIKKPASTEKPASEKMPEKAVEKPIEKEPKIEEKLNRAHVAKQTGGIMGASKEITEASIEKILDMNETFEKFTENQKGFVSGYFQLEEDESGNISKVIYRALTASERELDALAKIVVAKGKEPADRAFFLMELDNSVVEDVYEQVELLTGELGQPGRVTDKNKLKVCRKVEDVIDKMPKDVFTYIEKLQVFTNKAISK